MDDDIFEPEPEAELDDPPPEKAKAPRGNFLITQNSARIREQPGHRKVEFSFPREYIKDVPRSEYLLLGFDTEYQPVKETFSTDEIKAGDAKYEVLSYQFYAINSNGSEWSGIAIPDDGERIAFTDFIVHAISRGALLGEHVPRTIILVAHYNRADLPAFDDRKQLLWRLQNVRNSLVSSGLPIRLCVSFNDNESDDIDLSVYVRDTMLLAPAGRKSLAELGKLIGREKIRLSDDDAEELELKRTMKVLRAIDWDKFREYAILDAEISAKYFLKLTQMYQEVTKEKFVPTALSNIGMKLLIKDWKERSPDFDTTEMVGKENIEELVWDETSQQFRRIKHTPYVEELSWFVDFVAQCYHGGRNEQLWFGPSFEDDWYDYDLTSAYPTAMATIGKIDWRKIRPIANIEELKDGSLAFVCVDFKFPPNVRYPTLPVRTQNGIVFPLEGRSYCAMPEIELARQLDCDMVLKYGVALPEDVGEKVFFPFIKESIYRRTKRLQKLRMHFGRS